MKISLRNNFENVELTNNNQIEAVKKTAELLAIDLGASYQEIVSGLFAREAVSDTDVGEGVVINHAYSSDVKEPVLFVVSFDHEIGWNYPDVTQVDTIIAIVLPVSFQDHNFVQSVRDNVRLKIETGETFTDVRIDSTTNAELDDNLNTFLLHPALA
ncbi:PTS sugar transporter subunit IIA [Companilactobacillus sp.]|jgi:mannitol/fructose-specific phosphotransferase system IIA component (Ntr-type)|uniref:PTS sugar transporter subunit IIA n=1 Tax=Companilactobacillus sp. TaxID=2767905 RepID=UPI0025C06F80|nr:PTS sugar transporter subunit IIA [Companilactobacillus sp.]MCH4008559.1 PTS sugar transporter subunit IIA [Companilactobacillus sp.]MCH4051262.1 PTS sugar transporter subunit IIA [Companilactobacillus sp.]MCH4076502.1 PTS sugar transporter subunit IIA [Companilactobacillus sp.]MCH4125077.1 PTS sugar transporter subunit IIA [Companilactobacillus sp.]MCH4131618.1 PTS sugar transporter subunit IIA [Companilactobacillus sp.]